MMTKSAKLVATVAVGVGLSAVMAHPAFAQAAGGTGGDIQAVLQNIVNYMTGTTAKLIGTLAVMGLGCAWMFGLIDMRKAGAVILGLGLLFGAASLVGTFTG
jgi:type IV secretion system protein VirB2